MAQISEQTIIKIKRNQDFGRLYVNDKFICFTIDPHKLIDGTYNVIINYSPKFKCKLPLIFNEYYSANRGFRIHAGNTLKDSNGCILVGDEVRVKGNNATLVNSKIALNKLLKELGDKECQLIICQY